ncbi:MAG: 30S ribosomal protein S20 [Oligoflexales bacterium]|nr:30S ribosomal protein S20 [Oligoflexales bacterium]
MAQHKSAEKRIRGTERKRSFNRSYVSSVKTSVKKFKTAISGNIEPASIQKLFIEAQSSLAKAASKGVIHKNTASRSISRLSVLMKKALNK